MIKLNFEEGEEWYLEEYFEKIKEFRATSSYSSAMPDDSEGYLAINIQQYIFDKPQIFQENAINYFYNNQEQVLNALCEGLIKFYPKLMGIYNIEEHDTELGFSKLNNINDVKKVIGIGNVHILRDQKDNYSYIGFECGCPWDDEHGLGIIMHKERVIDIDSADIAFCGSKEVRKDNGSYTESERIKDEEWEKQIAENITKYKKEEEDIQIRKIEKEQRKLNKKWWQFWK